MPQNSLAKRRYLACTECRVYADAPYLCHLFEHRGLLRSGDAIDLERLLAHPDSSELTRLLTDAFTSLREFLDKHVGHRVVYWAHDHLPGDLHLNWLHDGVPDSSPRFYVEVLKMTCWEQVVQWRQALDRHWDTEEEREAFRRAFEEHLARFRMGT